MSDRMYRSAWDRAEYVRETCANAARLRAQAFERRVQTTETLRAVRAAFARGAPAVDSLQAVYERMFDAPSATRAPCTGRRSRWGAGT